MFDITKYPLREKNVPVIKAAKRVTTAVLFTLLTLFFVGFIIIYSGIELPTNSLADQIAGAVVLIISAVGLKLAGLIFPSQKNNLDFSDNIDKNKKDR